MLQSILDDAFRSVLDALRALRPSHERAGGDTTYKVHAKVQVRPRRKTPIPLRPSLALRRSAATRAASWTVVGLGLFALAPSAVSQPSAAGSPTAAPRPTAPLPGSVPATAPTLVVLGDSLSAGYGIRVEEGWVALLQKRLRAQGYGYRVVNASVSGETTGGALARLPRVLKVHRPAIMVVELGGNDGLRGVPIADFRDNLARITALSRAAGARVLILGMQIPTNYGPQYTRLFAGAFPAVAKEQQTALVPFFLEKIVRDEKWFQPDRIHPVASAQPLLLDTVWPALKPLLAQGGAKAAAASAPAPKSAAAN